MKDPAFLFYPQDFLVGTMTMTFEDRGKYITLLSIMHQQGKLSEETIRFLVGSFSDTLRLKFKQDENGLFYNERLCVEIEKRSKFIESRSNNGKLGGRPKKEETYKKPLGYATDNLIENENINASEIDLEKEGTGRKNKFVPPTIDQVIEYCNERNNNVDALRWMDFYQAKDWMIGKNRMKDWKAAIRTWENNNSNNNSNGKQKSTGQSSAGVSDDYKASILNRLGVS